MAMAGSVDVNSSSSLGFQIAVSITIVVVLFVMLVYLIYLRRNRIKAEEWLEENKHILFSGAKNLKTEEEILEALVKSKEMQDLLADPKTQRAVQQSQAFARANTWKSDEEDNKAQPLLTGDKPASSPGKASSPRSNSSAGSRKSDKGGRTSSHGSSKKMPAKTFAEKSEE